MDVMSDLVIETHVKARKNKSFMNPWVLIANAVLHYFVTKCKLHPLSLPHLKPKQCPR